MVNWLNYFFSFFILFLLGSCQFKFVFYEKEIVKVDYFVLLEQFMGGCYFYYQGVVGYILVMQEVMYYDFLSFILYWELGVLIVKCGMVKDFYCYY